MGLSYPIAFAILLAPALALISISIMASSLGFEALSMYSVIDLQRRYGCRADIAGFGPDFVEFSITNTGELQIPLPDPSSGEPPIYAAVIIYRSLETAIEVKKLTDVDLVSQTDPSTSKTIDVGETATFRVNVQPTPPGQLDGYRVVVLAGGYALCTSP